MYYKYRSDSKYTEQIFTTGKVHLSTAQALNDPFECSLQEIGKDWIEKKVLEMKQMAIIGFVMEIQRAIKRKESFFGISSKKLPDLLEDLYKKSGIENVYEYYRNFIEQKNGHPPSNCDAIFSNIDEQLNQVGIFSLSSSCSVQLLWAHYASDHKGICIGFSPEKESKLDDTEHFLKVTYSNEIPKMSENGFNTQMDMSLDKHNKLYTSSYKIAFTDKTFRSAISTKPVCWAYEEEWRYVESRGGEYDWPGKLSEIVFGLKCPQERRDHYIELAEKNIPNEVYLYEMVKQNNSNEVKRVPYLIKKTNPRMPSKNNGLLDHEGNKLMQLSMDQFGYEIMTLINEREFDEALFQVDTNLVDSPDSIYLLNLKGIAQGMKGDHIGALSTFKRINELFPNQPNGLFQESCALIALNRDDEAIKLLRKANELDHNDSSIPFNLGFEIIKNGGDRNEAKHFLNTARLMGHPSASLVLKEHS